MIEVLEGIHQFHPGNESFDARILSSRIRANRETFSDNSSPQDDSLSNGGFARIVNTSVLSFIKEIHIPASFGNPDNLNLID
ncbi:hypothetical protein Tco_0650704 [Tanacetum coccineum]